MDEELEWQVHRICSFIGVVHGTVNILLCTSVLVLQMNDVKKYHMNFVILRTNFLLACYGICIMRVANSVLTLLSPNNSALALDQMVILTRTVQNAGMHMLRLGFIALCLERLVATVYSATYEHRAIFRLLGPFLAILADMLATGMSIGSTIIGLPYFVNVSMALGLDLTGLFSVIALDCSNRRLRRLFLTSDIRLSKRYQLVENLRVLRYLLPLTATGIINSYVTVACLLTIWYYFKHAPGAAGRRIFSKRVENVPPAVTGDFRKPVIRNGLGEEIGQTATIDNHFNALSKHWEGFGHTLLR